MRRPKITYQLLSSVLIALHNLCIRGRLVGVQLWSTHEILEREGEGVISGNNIDIHVHKVFTSERTHLHV